MDHGLITLEQFINYSTEKSWVLFKEWLLIVTLFASVKKCKSEKKLELKISSEKSRNMRFKNADLPKNTNNILEFKRFWRIIFNNLNQFHKINLAFKPFITDEYLNAINSQLFNSFACISNHSHWKSQYQKLKQKPSVEH